MGLERGGSQGSCFRLLVHVTGGQWCCLLRQGAGQRVSFGGGWGGGRGGHGHTEFIAFEMPKQGCQVGNWMTKSRVLRTVWVEETHVASRLDFTSSKMPPIGSRTIILDATKKGEKKH